MSAFATEFLTPQPTHSHGGNDLTLIKGRRLSFDSSFDSSNQSFVAPPGERQEHVATSLPQNGEEKTLAQTEEGDGSWFVVGTKEISLDPSDITSHVDPKAEETVDDDDDYDGGSPQSIIALCFSDADANFFSHSSSVVF